VKNILFQLDQVHKAQVEYLSLLTAGSTQQREPAQVKVEQAKTALATLLVTSDSKSDIRTAVTKQNGDDFQVKSFTIPSNNYPKTNGCNEVQLQAHTLFMKSLLNVPAVKTAPPKPHQHTVKEPKSTATQYYESADKIVSALTK